MLQILHLDKWLDDNLLYHGDLNLDGLIVNLDSFRLKIITFNLAILAPSRDF